MKRIALVAIAVMVALGTAAFAGTIHGKVSGVSGESVVYIEAVAGKTFPAPAQHITIDQKGLMFVPHITVVQQGTTVEFLNSDSVAHNVFWPAISGNKKLGHNLGTWPQGQRNLSSLMTPASCLCFAMFTRRCRLTSSSRRRPTSRRPTNPANSRSTTCRMAPTP